MSRLTLMGGVNQPCLHAPFSNSGSAKGTGDVAGRLQSWRAANSGAVGEDAKGLDASGTGAEEILRFLAGYRDMHA
jgi:hypothetical protein